MRFPFLRSASAPAALALLALANSPAHAQVGTVSVDARSSIFSQAGNPTGAVFRPGIAGSLTIALNPGVNRVLTFPSVTGAIAPATLPPGGADGADYTGTGIDIDTLGVVSGYLDDTSRQLALLGVFTLDDPASLGSAPARLNFSGNHAFTSLAPLINQSFFIGDGLTGTGTGALQQFLIPDAAAFLHLGFGDAFSPPTLTPFIGPPSSYDDNIGSLSVTFNVTPAAAAVPEPGTLALLAPGVLPLLGLAARRRRA